LIGGLYAHIAHEDPVPGGDRAADRLLHELAERAAGVRPRPACPRGYGCACEGTRR
jgi:hypothetical protein